MSSRQPLDVIEGLRGAEMPERQVVEKPVEPRYTPHALPEGTVEYHSMTGGLWLLLGDGTSLRDPVTGRDVSIPPVTIQFAQGIALTADPEKIHRIEGCAKGCELHPKGMPQHPGFGIGRTLWRADAARKVAAQKQEEADIERLKANPEQAARLLQQLQAAGFDLPARKPEKTQKSSEL